MNKLEVKGKLKDIKLPDGWTRVNLNKVCNLSYGKNLAAINFREDGKYKVFGANGVIGHYNKFTHEESVVLVSCRGEYSGVINISEDKSYITNNSIPLAIKDKNLLNTFYLYYFLKLIPKNNFVSGSAQPQVVINDLKLLDIFFPPLQIEQQKISEILETVGKVIEKTDVIIEKYKRIKEGLMQDLLTRGIDENGQIRSEETHKFKDSSLGRIPKKWEVVELGHKDITMLITDGSHFSPQSFDDSEYYIATIENIKNNKIDISSCKKISKKDYKYLQRNNCKPQIDDMLFTKDGTIGIVFKFTQKEKLVLLSSIAIIRIQKILLPDYLVQYLRSNFIWKQLGILSGGSALKRVVLRDLKKVLILLPSLPEQHRIASILSQIDDTIEKEQKYKEKLKRIKQGLMKDLLTGKVRVNHLIKEGVESV